MKIKKYTRDKLVIAGLLCGVALCTALYRSSANNSNIIPGDKSGVVENELDKEDGVVGDETVAGKENDESEVGGVDSDVVIDDVQGDISGSVVENKEVKGEGDVSEIEIIENKNTEAMLMKLDKNLPKLVGVDATKEALEDGMPILPGFEEKGSKYVCELNNIYQTVIEMYEVEEKDGDKVIKKVVVKVGSGVLEDEQLQGVVELILDYYNGHKWNFVFLGVDSYFEILL